MDIEKRMANLENLVNSFIKNQRRIDEYVGYDVDGTRRSIADTNSAVSQNGEDITTTMEGLTETAETVDTNYADIDSCMVAITELYEMIGR